MLYFLYILGIFIAKVVPLRICYFFADFVARFYYMLAREDKKGLAENLKVVLGENVDERVIKRHALDVFRNFAKYLGDFFKFPRFSREYISKHIDLVGDSYLEECRKAGKGVILLSMHLGNWELGGAVIGALKYPVSAIVLEHENKKINNFFINQRAINGLRSIPLGFRLKECFKVLKRNEFLAIAGDKSYTSGGIVVDFFGRKCVLPMGAAALSLKTGAPIIFCSLTREKGDHFKFAFEKPIYPEFISDDFNENVKHIMGKCVKHFEKYVRAYPDQWYVFRKLWKRD